MAFCLIFAVHVGESLFGYAIFGNPSKNWPSVAAQIEQIKPLTGHGASDLFANLVRYTGWLGHAGVQLFIIIGGFGLVWGLYQKKAAATLPLKEFYLGRARRIYPMWVTAHIFLIVFAVVTGLLSISAPVALLSSLGIRFLPSTFYALTPAWWYVGMLIQFYMVFPFLWKRLRTWGPAKFLILALLISFSVRGIGLFLCEYTGHYLDLWSRGAIFITRLPEFAFGMALGHWMFHMPERTDAWLRSGWSVLAGGGALVLGIALAMTLIGMTFALFLIGLGLFLPIYALVRSAEGATPDITKWLAAIGANSYALYLVHHPIVQILVRQNHGEPFEAWAGVAPNIALAVVTAILLTWQVAKLLKATSGYAVELLTQNGSIFEFAKSLIPAMRVLLVVIVALLAADFAATEYSPETFGWMAWATASHLRAWIRIDGDAFIEAVFHGNNGALRYSSASSQHFGSTPKMTPQPYLSAFPEGSWQHACFWPERLRHRCLPLLPRPGNSFAAIRKAPQ